MEITIGQYNGAPTATLKNSAGMVVSLCGLGAGIMSIQVPSRTGEPTEVIKPAEKGYGNSHNGLTTGRTAGRIANAEFTIGGRTAHLEKNNHGVDNLHGGQNALHRALFTQSVERRDEYTDVKYAYDSPDGEGGYFGNVALTVTYRVYENKNTLDITYYGVPDCKTLLDITNHSYFNVSGVGKEKVTEQTLYVNASRVGVLGERSLVVSVKEVTPPFDFRKAHKIGDYIKDDRVTAYAGGYDHPFFLDERGVRSTACRIHSALSGINLEVSTSYPCAVIYTDNAHGNEGICFECQYHPDGIHFCPEDCGVCSPEKPYNEIIRFSFGHDQTLDSKAM